MRNFLIWAVALGPLCAAGCGGAPVPAAIHDHTGPTPTPVTSDAATAEVVIDSFTFRPMELGEGGAAAEDPGYAWTWSGRGPR